MKSAKRETTRSWMLPRSCSKPAADTDTDIWRLNAAAFGVPQDRIRYFLVASRMKIMPVPPTADYQDTRRPNSIMMRFRPQADRSYL